MAYLTSNIPSIANDAVKDALAKTNGITNLDTTDIVSMGKQLSSMELLEGFYSALTNRIVKTIYFIRSYQGNTRSILRDEHEYGAFVQKVYYKMPDAVDSATWEIPDNQGDYKQASPYDVENTIEVSSKIYGGRGAWTIEFIRPLEQIKSAFLSSAAMSAFVDGLFVTAENAWKLEEERLVAAAANTSIAKSIEAGKARNLLSEYNTAHSSSLTVAQAMESADFLRYATKEINRTIKNMSVMSTAYSAEGYETFTDKQHLVCEILAEFASFSAIYLQSETYHKELVSLPKYTEIPFWQSSGKNFAFADCSKIDITNEALIDTTHEDGKVTQSGIICFLHDDENVAAYFGNKRQWSMINPRSEVAITGMKAEKGFAIDNNANAFVFYVA